MRPVCVTSSPLVADKVVGSISLQNGDCELISLCLHILPTLRFVAFSEGFPPNLLFFLPPLAVEQWQSPHRSPSSCRKGTVIHADQQLHFCSRESPSFSFIVIHCSRERPHFRGLEVHQELSTDAFPLPIQNCQTKKGCSSFSHVSKTKTSLPSLPTNKPPSSSTSPLGITQQLLGASSAALLILLF